MIARLKGDFYPAAQDSSDQKRPHAFSQEGRYLTEASTKNVHGDSYAPPDSGSVITTGNDTIAAGNPRVTKRTLGKS